MTQLQSIVPFCIVMISWLGFFSPKGMLPYQSTQTDFHSAFLRKPSFFVPLSLAQRTAPQTLLTVSIEASPSSTSFSSAPSLFSSFFFCRYRLCVWQWQTTFIGTPFFFDHCALNGSGQERLVLTEIRFLLVNYTIRGMTDSPKSLQATMNVNFGLNHQIQHLPLI